MMSIKIKIGLFIALILIAFNLSAKPQSSIVMKMNWADGFSYEQSIVVRVVVTSQISSEKMRFKLSVPDGVVVSRDTEFESIIEKNVPLNMEFTVFIPSGTQGQIDAEASIGDSHQVFFRAIRKLMLGNIAISKKMQPANNTIDPSFQHTERNGVMLREYRLP